MRFNKILIVGLGQLGLPVAHAPHRWYALEEKEHGVNQLRVVGGVYDCCLEAAMQFYCNGGGGGNSSNGVVSIGDTGSIGSGSSSSNNDNHVDNHRIADDGSNDNNSDENNMNTYN